MNYPLINQMNPKKIKVKLFKTILLFFFLFSTQIVFANDEIFPGIAGANEKVNWKDGYFFINGKGTILSGGEIHYSRIPRELWRDRLWRIKQMGINTIQAYVFWNAHEPREGVWDFSDNLDLDAFLKLTHEMGFYTMVRVGPYCCAEWEHGGFPAWLTVKPGMVVRDNDENYLRYVDRHLAKIYEIVNRHQIHKGGSVIMAQLENEYPRGWGTDPNPHLMHLYSKAREAGLEIPLFFSGLHHGQDPAGENPFEVGTTPWYTTELWSGWIGRWGDMIPAILNQKIRATWKAIAFGGGGYGYYVVHGGTNFGYSNGSDNNEASYDYSAPIGEAGQLRNFYGPSRRASLFARSFSEILTSSVNAPTLASSKTGNRTTSRKSPQGSIVFTDNFSITKGKNYIPPTASALKLENVDPGKKALQTRIQVEGRGEFPKNGDRIIPPEEIRTLLLDLPWTPQCSFESISANVLLRRKIGEIDTWVCYGTPEEYGEITLKRSSGRVLPSLYSFQFPSGNTVKEILIDSGDGSQARFLIMNTTLADQTWVTESRLIVGPSFIREDGQMEFPAEGGSWTSYGATQTKSGSQAKVEPSPLPELKSWTWRDAAQERKPDYDDKNWAKSVNPEPMESYESYQNRYGWYRTTIKGGGETPQRLQLLGSEGRMTAFLNGEPAEMNSLPLKSGDNTLAILVKANPRPKWFNFMGLSGREPARGLWGPTILANQPLASVKKWRSLLTEKKEVNPAFIKADFNDSAWEEFEIKPGEKKKLSKNFFWIRGTFEITDGSKNLIAFPPARSRSKTTIYFNEKQVPLYKQQEDGFDATPYLKTGKNTVAILIEFDTREEAWCEPVFGVWKGQDHEWKFRPSLEGLQETAIIGRVLNWKSFSEGTWNSSQAVGDLPRFWKTSFNYHRQGAETIGLITEGLDSGHIWVNGHNLGESPQKVPMYIPECWLKESGNEIIVFDLKGRSPKGLKLSRFESRQVVP